MVVFAQWTEDLGYMIILSHGDSYFTVYGHNKINLVTPREWVERGQAIAQVGGMTNASVHIYPSTPKDVVGLQVVDYYLWALQRFYEKDEDRFLELIWPQTKLVHDLDDTRETSFGMCYSPQKALTLEARSGERKKKSRRI